MTELDGRPGRLRRLPRAAAEGAALALTSTASLALLLVALRPFVLSSAVLRESLLCSLGSMAVVGALGGTIGGLVAPRSRRSPGAAAVALAVALVTAEYAWTGWDGQGINSFLATGPILWAGRIRGSIMILVCAGCALVAYGLAGGGWHRRSQRVRALVTAVPIVVLAAAMGWGATSEGRPSERRLVLLGIDGVGPDLLRRLTRMTRLPNIERLMEEGSVATMIPEPPFSPPSWSTLATGKLPVRHRVDNWDRNDRATGRRVRLRREAIDAVTIFDIVEGSGLGSGVFEWPMVGRRVAGLSDPVNRSAIMLLSFGPRLRYLFAQAAHMTAEKRERSHLTYGENETGLLTLAHYFWKAAEPRLFGLGVKSTDSAQHFFWRSLDPERYELPSEEADRTADHILSLYRIADRMIGDFLDDPATDVIVFSDHGATGIPTDRPVPFHLAYRARLTPLLETWGFVQRRHPEGDIDFERSTVYECSDRTLHQHVCVNITEARSRATATGPEDLLEAGRADIQRAAELFQALRFVDDGTPVFPGSYGTRWNGADLEASWLTVELDAPPVFFPNFDDFDMDLGSGFEIVPFQTGFWEREVTDGTHRWNASELFEPLHWEGNHAVDGLIAVHGSAFATNAVVEGARGVDLVPTALHVLGLPIGRDMDGRVLTELLAPSPPTFADSIPAEGGWVETWEGLVERKSQDDGSSYDAKLERDLKALGYIE